MPVYYFFLESNHACFPQYTSSLFGWLVADDWCWFVLREEYCWLVAGNWFVVREKYCWLVADKPKKQGEKASKQVLNGHV
jgi:hypothetical protein